MIPAIQETKRIFINPFPAGHRAGAPTLMIPMKPLSA
jgi:hypothetical protein